MATDPTVSAVPGSVYARYSASEVVDMMDMEEPAYMDSDDDLELDVMDADEM